jgi:two-component system nitrate/nitrite response regulator NarP
MNSSTSITRPPGKLLVVEDSPFMQETIIQLLQGVPHLRLVGVADTAEDALAAFAQHQPDVVILDLVLRIGTGLMVLREIRRRSAACRVLVFTTYAEPQYRARCLAEGADHFILKSHAHRELVRWLCAWGGEATVIGPPA